MPAIIEDLYVDWISREIADYFRKLGFTVRYTAVSQPVEKIYPFDRFYAVGSDFSGISIFAIQFKAPERHKYGLKFQIDHQQLKQLQRGEFLNWIYYGLPYFTIPQFQSNCLYLTNFIKPLSIPPLDELKQNNIFWRLPYFFIEFNSDLDSEVMKKVEMHKVFDDFYHRGEKTEWLLTRKSCVYIEKEGKHRDEIPHCSWGELFNSLLTQRAGRYFEKKDDFDKFITILHEVNYKPSNAILGALDSIRGVVKIVSVLSRRENEFKHDENEITF
jgi:hypothetical protein